MGGGGAHTHQLRLFLLRAPGQARGDPRRAGTGPGRRCPNYGRQAVARVTLPRGEGGAAPLCVKNIFAGVFSYPFVTSIDTTKPVPAAALASLTPNAPAPGSKEQMIAEEMEKFREKQAQRDKELEDERRRKLQAKVQEAQNLEKTIAASLDSAKKRTLGMKGGAEKRPKLETPAATALAPNAPKLGFSLGAER